VWEATAPKPGNVHPEASFADLTYADFIASAVVSGPILERAADEGVGPTVLAAVRATRDTVGTNTNLGTLLLIAPLAAVPRDVPLVSGIGGVLERLTPDDTRLVYEAIRVSGAGGLGSADKADIFSEAPSGLNLVEAMRLAADRDLVARQYINQFADVFAGPAAWIEESVAHGWLLRDAIVLAHVRQIAAAGDSLIARKCGQEYSDQARNRAAEILASGQQGAKSFAEAVAKFDAWLRSDGHRRNSGTTADLIAAALFVLLRDGRLDWTAVKWS
jgi:triphosphoribosyl-dephospho-CoA synthase